MTTFDHLPRVLVAIGFLFLAVPVWGDDGTPDPAASQDTGSALEQAETLLGEGKIPEALATLSALVESRPVDMEAFFEAGLLGIGVSNMPGMPGDIREEFLDVSIKAFRTMLVQQPELVRVRLELARAHYMKNEDGEAKEQFERVLAGSPPDAVVTNVNRFLVEIRNRRRWSTYFGFALAPDSNIGSSSDARTINIFGLPFTRDQEELTSSGVGLSIWGGGEYHYPLAERLRLRVGGDVSRQEYAGSRFDRMTLSTHVGPRWLIGQRSRASLLAIARHHRRTNESYSDDLGFSTEANHRFTQRTSGNLRASWVERRHDAGSGLDGPITDLSLTANHVMTPALRGNLTLGWARDRPKATNNRNNARWVQVGMTSSFPRGLTVSGEVTHRWTDYEGNWFPHTPVGVSREDLLRSYRVSGYHPKFSWRGFSPKVTVAYEERDTNAQLYDYERTFGELSFVRVF